MIKKSLVNFCVKLKHHSISKEATCIRFEPYYDAQSKVDHSQKMFFQYKEPGCWASLGFRGAYAATKGKYNLVSVLELICRCWFTSKLSINVPESCMEAVVESFRNKFQIVSNSVFSE